MRLGSVGDSSASGCRDVDMIESRKEEFGRAKRETESGRGPRLATEAWPVNHWSAMLGRGGASLKLEAKLTLLTMLNLL